MLYQKALILRDNQESKLMCVVILYIPLILFFVLFFFRKCI